MQFCIRNWTWKIGMFLYKKMLIFVFSSLVPLFHFQFKSELNHIIDTKYQMHTQLWIFKKPKSHISHILTQFMSVNHITCLYVFYSRHLDKQIHILTQAQKQRKLDGESHNYSITHSTQTLNTECISKNRVYMLNFTWIQISI